MSVLQHEIQSYVDSNPGVVRERIRDDQIEIEIRDAGSARAAQVVFGAFGQVIANRRAEQKRAELEAKGQKFPTLDTLRANEERSVREIKAKLAVARHDTEVLTNQQGSLFKVSDAEGELFVDTMAAAPELTEQLADPNPALAYYAGVTPHLLDTAVTSVDGNNYKYSI